MSRIGINRNKARLRGALGIRARLVLFALILVGPLMVERIRALHSVRAQQIETASRSFAEIAQHSVDAQREVFASIEAVLKASAYIHSTAAQVDRSCAIMRASLRGDMPWLRSLTVAGIDGTPKCSTLPQLIASGINFADRAYFKQAVASGDFTVSDYLFSRLSDRPSLMAAYLAPGETRADDAVILAAVDLGWMSKLMSNLGDRPGVTALLIDHAGIVLAAPPTDANTIGRPMADIAMLPLIADNLRNSQRQSGTLTYAAEDGTRRAVSFAIMPGTSAKLVASIDEARVSADADHDIRTAYLQLAAACLFALLGALVVAERMIIKPIQTLAAMATGFGRGDWSARLPRASLPAEFLPLARAFYGMAAQLRGRERELRASNEQLTVLASVDMLSGLANRRGFQSRLDFEWLRAEQGHDHLALLMIDVDHFKSFNDSYGHPQGDACLARVSAALAAIADRVAGFAGRYGGEEFCLLLPGSDMAHAAQVGEMVRSAIAGLAMPHANSPHQRVTVSVGVATAAPTELQTTCDLIEAADAALYAAKRRGRNAVVEHGFDRSRPAAVPLRA